MDCQTFVRDILMTIFAKASHTRNVKEWFLLPINSSVNKLSNLASYHNTTYKMLTGIRMSTSARYPLNATGWLVLEITNQLVNDIAICDILSAMGP